MLEPRSSGDAKSSTVSLRVATCTSLVSPKQVCAPFTSFPCDWIVSLAWNPRGATRVECLYPYPCSSRQDTLASPDPGIMPGAMIGPFRSRLWRIIVLNRTCANTKVSVQIEFRSQLQRGFAFCEIYGGEFFHKRFVLRCSRRCWFASLL